MKKTRFMTPKRAAAYFVGAVLLAAWLASAAVTSRQDGDSQMPARAVSVSGTETLAADVQAQAARLRQRMAEAPAPQPPVRNPFVFGSREVAPPEARRTSPPPLPPPPVAAEPRLTLVGVAEQQTPTGRIRTAMIAGEEQDDLFMLTEGQVLGGRYRVTAIGADAVELLDTLTGLVRRLALR